MYAVNEEVLDKSFALVQYLFLAFIMAVKLRICLVLLSRQLLPNPSLYYCVAEKC